MLKLCIVLVIVSINGFSQSAGPVKFKDIVFNDVTVQNNLHYTSLPIASRKYRYSAFDFYEPKNDSSRSRPLILWLHGGGFKFGTKRSNGTPLWSKTFAQRGYVCAAINYRLSQHHPLKSFPDLVNGCADAADDVSTAIAFFKSNAAKFRIDTNRIIIGGNSAGGILALQTAYSNRASLTALIDSSNGRSANAGSRPIKIGAVINFWGALFSPAVLKNARVPIVSVAGRKDRVVPIGHNKQSLYGSAIIKQFADSLKIPNRLSLYDGLGHELQKHFNPLFAGSAAHKRWLEAGQFAADFLYDELIKN